MNLAHSRMVATFVEGATVFDTGHPSTMQSLAQSLNFAWTSVYTNAPDADRALAWLKANVIGISPVTCVHEHSPIWLSTVADVPHNRHEEPLYDEGSDYEYPDHVSSSAIRAMKSDDADIEYEDEDGRLRRARGHKPKTGFYK
jgi:hypothetical protein